VILVVSLLFLATIGYLVHAGLRYYHHTEGYAVETDGQMRVRDMDEQRRAVIRLMYELQRAREAREAAPHGSK